MEAVFYISGATAVAATAFALTRRNAAHALLYLVVSLLAVAVVFYTLGAPFIAALEAIVYAGAIMVLFVFVIMMLNPVAGSQPEDESLREWKLWIGPSILAVILGAELLYLLGTYSSGEAGRTMVAPGVVGVSLLGPYALGVELASMLLLAALVAAYHLGRRDLPGEAQALEEKGGTG